MNLVTKVISFNTLELLEAMIEVSSTQLERYQEVYCDTLIELSTVSFNLGRQVGHTSSVMEYCLKTQDRKDRGVIVLTPNHPILETYRRGGVDLSYTINGTYRGFTGTVFNPVPHDIIFDSCSMDDVTQYLRKTYNVVMALRTSPGASINSIVCVGCY